MRGLILSLLLSCWGGSFATANRVTVYVMDNGIRADHTAFEGVSVETVDLVSGESGVEDGTLAYGSHATLMAGVIVAGAPGVNLVSVRTLNEAGEGTWSQFIRGVHWIINHHKPGQTAVANLSLGGVPGDPWIEKLLIRAVNQLVEDGVTVVVAAGNEGNDVSGRIPSTLDAVISVGAVSKLNFRLISSNYGSCVDVYAPGENLRGPDSRSVVSRTHESGTSMAAAVVAGAAVRYIAEHPHASPETVKAWLLATSERGKVKNLPQGLRTESLLWGQ